MRRTGIEEGGTEGVELPPSFIAVLGVGKEGGVAGVLELIAMGEFVGLDAPAPGAMGRELHPTKKRMKANRRNRRKLTIIVFRGGGIIKD